MSGLARLFIAQFVRLACLLLVRGDARQTNIRWRFPPGDHGEIRSNYSSPFGPSVVFAVRSKANGSSPCPLVLTWQLKKLLITAGRTRNILVTLVAGSGGRWEGERFCSPRDGVCRRRHFPRGHSARHDWGHGERLPHGEPAGIVVLEPGARVVFVACTPQLQYLKR